jgi:hypothetical protein
LSAGDPVDPVGLALRDRDSTFPHSRETATTIAAKAGLPERDTWRLLRGNAIECYRLDRYGITETRRALLRVG